ncbi:class I SAM-dependent DNA methyltransferase [Salidesulfovibrio brasiliensis]|uniref:class I SAM-dependent DNA methyltransferase n=1 Tax=Salidesulfovibrio brasiliensis TaxID=221711 RepID=UPI0006D23B1A|nr:DNA methyltransferase [Salidesulfovibrio brasiliensis]
MAQDARQFINRWKGSGGAELANSQSFLKELCALLDVPEPEPAKDDISQNEYVFERDVDFHHADGSISKGRIDLYKRQCFVLESKQGVLRQEQIDSLAQSSTKRKKGTAVRNTKGWDEAILKAFGQAERYVRALPAPEGRPPFILVVDVGFTIDVYSEFSCTGGDYIPFPDPGTNRIHLNDLESEEIRERLKLIWTDPFALDPSRRAAKVTRHIASRLAKLAKSLEAAGHSPTDVSGFLMRCLFTMFAEDVQLLPKDSFTDLLKSMRSSPEEFPPMVEELWGKMDTGGFSTALRQKIKHFNGGLFAEHSALPLDEQQLELLIDAADSDWRDVEPAIFGTLLERALDPRERHKLGAHYTPRSYVERLVIPSLMTPLRREWEAVQTAAVTLMNQDKKEKALENVQAFHRKLCKLHILDPACGSGNFLYVALEHLKRLEGEILSLEQKLGFSWMKLEGGGLTVSPDQFLGLEVNPRAAAIAELVLWIGYLQWYFRTWKDVSPAEPIIRDFKNIKCQDALLTWKKVEPVLDDDGNPVCRWDGQTTKKHPTTGQEVPDETALVPTLRYHEPKPASWPKADYIIGNPPFIGASTMRRSLGNGYVDALREAYPDIPSSCDFVMYWWDHAARLVRNGSARRFGLIATNSLRQTFNRRIVKHHMEASSSLSLSFAIPDHPWVQESDGAAVRISMSVGMAGDAKGQLCHVVEEKQVHDIGYDVVLAKHKGKIHSDLTIGADVADTTPLTSNIGISSRGVQLMGSGFIVTREQATDLGLGRVPGLERHIRQYRNGKDLNDKPRGVMVIDLYGLEPHEVRSDFPEVYQWVLERVKPVRDQNNRAAYRDNWWIFGEPRKVLREMLKGLPRYIATAETSKHRFFQFLGSDIMADNKLISVALDDAYFLGILSSKVHLLWAQANRSNIGKGNDLVYVKSRCFETFPFPEVSSKSKARIRQLAEELDAHRKKRLQACPGVSMTKMYNVLEKMRNCETLTEKEQKIHDDGLLAILQELHDKLDQAVLDAYGWDTELSDEDILKELVTLNKARAAEEDRGVIRWLRPDYQLKQAGASTTKQGKLKTREKVAKQKVSWPKSMSDQAQVLLEALSLKDSPITVQELAKDFKGMRKAQAKDLLSTLATIGKVIQLDNEKFQAI